MFDYKFQDNCKLTIENENILSLKLILTKRKENENILSLKLILTNKNHKTSM